MAYPRSQNQYANWAIYKWLGNQRSMHARHMSLPFALSRLGISDTHIQNSLRETEAKLWKSDFSGESISAEGRAGSWQRKWVPLKAGAKRASSTSAWCAFGTKNFSPSIVPKPRNCTSWLQASRWAGSVNGLEGWAVRYRRISSEVRAPSQAAAWCRISASPGVAPWACSRSISCATSNVTWKPSPMVDTVSPSRSRSGA